MTNFKTGFTYNMKWIGDADMNTPIEILKRTAKTVTIKDLHSRDTKRCKIEIYEGVEMIYPTGKYSMSPCLKASRLA